MTKLNARSKKLRLDIIKLSKANGGYHYGGSFSCAEILINLYDKILLLIFLFGHNSKSEFFRAI